MSKFEEVWNIVKSENRGTLSQASQMQKQMFFTGFFAAYAEMSKQIDNFETWGPTKQEALALAAKVGLSL